MKSPPFPSIHKLVKFGERYTGHREPAMPGVPNAALASSPAYSVVNFLDLCFGGYEPQPSPLFPNTPADLHNLVFRDHGGHDLKYFQGSGHVVRESAEGKDNQEQKRFCD